MYWAQEEQETADEEELAAFNADADAYGDRVALAFGIEPEPRQAVTSWWHRFINAIQRRFHVQQP